MINLQTFCRFLITFLLVLASITLLGVYIYRLQHYQHQHQNANTQIQQLFYTQTLNHFNVDSTKKQTFQQGYFIDRTHWVGGEPHHGPIFVVLGGNTPITTYVSQVGIINECAPNLGALVIYIEHRFYGESVPYEWPIEKAIDDHIVRSYLTSSQALRDYEEIIVNLKTNLSALHSPVVLVGSFYGGILATWLMMTSPNLAVGALVSSSPIYYFYKNPEGDMDDFCALISKDFKGTNPPCHDVISRSWSAIDRIASQPNGLANLSTLFQTCRPLQSAYELKSYLAHFYTFVAQYTGPYNQQVHLLCDQIMNSPDTDIVSRIASGVLAMTYYHGYCHNISGIGVFENDDSSIVAWSWQECNEFVITTGCKKNSMLPVELFDVSHHLINCKQQYGKSPPADWNMNQIGGNDLHVALSNITGNMIFSNGRKDPYSSKGVLHDISNTSIAITTEQGSHALDLMLIKPNDPGWLVRQRQEEIKFITQWIKQYSPP